MRYTHLRNCLLVLLWPGALLAQGKDVEVKVTPLFPMKQVTDPVTLEIQFRNVSSADLKIARARVEMPASYGRDAELEADQASSFELNASHVEIRTWKVPAVGFPGSLRLARFLYPPQKPKITYTYSMASGSDEHGGSEEIELAPVAADSAVFLGAAVGVLITVGLRLFKGRGSDTPRTSRSSLLKGLVAGLFVSAVYVLALRLGIPLLSSVTLSSLTINVNDIVGGIVVGLLHAPLSDKLLEKIDTKAPAKPDAPKG